MSIYTVYEPPLRAPSAAHEPERFVFVRDGFYFWAFVVTWLWMLWHRMWLAFLLYVVAVAAVEAAIRYAGVSTGVVILSGFCISLLIGIEASSLRRVSLSRHGWRNAGVVAGDNLEQAERRFFEAWVRSKTPPSRAETSAAAATASVASTAPHPAHSPDIIGLFPDPGASR